MSYAKRTTVTLPAGLYARAQAAMREQDFSTFSDYIQYLLREDARSQGSYTTPTTPAHPPAKPVNYRKTSKKDTRRKILDIVKKKANQAQPPTPPTK